MRTLDFPSTCLVAMLTIFVFSAVAALGAQRPRSEASLRSYIGTYSGAKSKGIYTTRFNPQNGEFSPAELAAEVTNPAFLALHPNARWLYAVNETDRFGGHRAGAVSAFRIDPASGKLTLLNQQPSGGTGPCHLSVDKSGKCLLVANYGSGSVAAFLIGPNGELSEPVTTIQHRGSSINPQRQSGPHAHQIVPDPKNRFALVCDLGLDQVLIYKLDPAKARLSPHDPPCGRLEAGAGPRHLAFHPAGTWLYVLNELTSTLTTFAYKPRAGTLTELGTVSTLPDAFQGPNSGAEVQVHPSGKYVYSSNRGDNSIAIFQVEPATGIARYLGRESTQGKTPRHFAIDPAGLWLIAENQDSGSLVPFRIDQNTGKLTASGKMLEVSTPVCLVFVPL